MPFVNQEHREHPDPLIAGDRCYLHYKKMIETWKVSPRWTTVDGILKGLIKDDEQRAFALAFLQFYLDKVVAYEDSKRLENGDIT